MADAMETSMKCLSRRLWKAMSKSGPEKHQLCKTKTWGGVQIQVLKPDRGVHS